ncbi:YqaI family protein [Rossellomorea sp. BNER]|uniref:YqaI family protein n=1 Tax=Rossellomorea sp. BNER TaxID=2962031 RepID=UPI003AF2ECBE|nr:hypothetical protein [Rossellomorea sp. BNER]
MLEHPEISKVERFGYTNVVSQPEHNGTDYFGNEILVGDSIVLDPDNGEVVLEENLEDYLIEKCKFYFTTAE